MTEKIVQSKLAGWRCMCGMWIVDVSRSSEAGEVQVQQQMTPISFPHFGWFSLCAALGRSEMGWIEYNMGLFVRDLKIYCIDQKEIF